MCWVGREEEFHKFIPRLDGMHMLTSFVSAVGYLMAGSGIEHILGSTFAGVPKMLSGKKQQQQLKNVRAPRLLTRKHCDQSCSTQTYTRGWTHATSHQQSTQSETARWTVSSNQCSSSRPYWRNRRTAKSGLFERSDCRPAPSASNSLQCPSDCHSPCKQILTWAV